jgi:hypothetical protein
MAFSVSITARVAGLALSAAFAFTPAHGADAPAAGAVAGQPADHPSDRPARGAHMAAVEQQYGQPSTRYPAVGQPPITRWDYPSMIVYFENDRVIHAVLVGPGS